MHLTAFSRTEVCIKSMELKGLLRLSDGSDLRPSELSNIEKMIDLAEHRELVNQETSSWRQMYYGIVIRTIFSIRLAFPLVQHSLHKRDRESPRTGLLRQRGQVRILLSV